MLRSIIRENVKNFSRCSNPPYPLFWFGSIYWYMKYLITQEQLDKIIFKYLGSKRFVQVERNNIIYFVKEDNEYAKIVYDKDFGRCLIYYKLIDEISSFFSLEESDSEKVIARWVENTLQMKVTYTLVANSTFWILAENTQWLIFIYNEISYNTRTTR